MPSIIIIGGGPAGLSAAIYAARANIPTTILYQDGGALGKTDKIENYFGFPETLSGAELCLARAQDGQLFIRLACADPASFQTAVGAQDALRSALERSGENVRVEIVQSRADGGNEGDARQQSRGRQDYVPDVE